MTVKDIEVHLSQAQIQEIFAELPADELELPAQAIDIEPRLKQARDEDPNVANCLNVALQLEGLFRNASTHAAGVVIGDRPLTQLTPLYKDPRSDLPATQFNMKWVESAAKGKTPSFR